MNKQIHFDDQYIYMECDGETLRQSLLWYPALMKATEKVKKSYVMSSVGIHWREIDVDISFESFAYADAEPKSWQRFFLTNPSINLAQCAHEIGMEEDKLYRYVYGLAIPNEAEERLLKNKL